MRGIAVDDTAPGGEESAIPATGRSQASAHASTVRVAFVGPSELIDRHAPAAPARGIEHRSFAIEPWEDRSHALDLVRAHAADVTVVLRPGVFSADALGGLAGVTLGVLDAPIRDGEDANALDRLDRLLSFDPLLTGMHIARSVLWRAVPPPVSDRLFGDVRELHRAPRVMSIGHSTRHREAMLIEAKHRHDLLQVVHGVNGADLLELLREYDVAVHIAPEDGGGGCGWQVTLHLAAGQLLLSEPLVPARGLESDIDYVRVDSPEGLAWTLERLARFPEMHQRVRIRGRLKAEQFRASTVFARIVHDLLLDVEAFGARAS